tara:strand:+ start:16756 stop:17598 length:843 start_codon:yes stop_codon:yes gene_type:complete
MSTSYLPEPAFIQGERGPLFSLHCAPVAGIERHECLVVVPSFSEEMNRCRYMTTMLAQALAPNGVGMLTVDPYGTGDSAGEFEDADWQQWVLDIRRAISYAKELGYHRVSLLAIRLGALLACEAMTALTDIHRLILWQPVVSGKSSLHQFLRIKIAASIGRDEEAGSIAQFEEVLDRGQSIQVAGYDISPALYAGIQSAHLDGCAASVNCPVAWFTVLASEERKTPRPDQKTMELWRSRGIDLEHHTVIGPAFWQAHERTLAPTLVEATAALILERGESA